MEQELARYRSVEKVHDLPDIYHVWSQAFLAPKLESVGFSSIENMWAHVIGEVAAVSHDHRLEIVSLGSGNCDLEVDLASRLIADGNTNFQLTCLEINTEMLLRGQVCAQQRGLADHFRFVTQDLNRWEAPGRIDVFTASHSLHHLVELERVFDEVARSLEPDGAFLINDMIGRNGHMRWPEALWIVERIWASLPTRCKYNHQLQRVEETYVNWDCSAEGYEGVRAQEILPLLRKRFGFEVFVGFANVISPFVDRSFGHNFDPALPEDVEFIKQVGLLDDLLIDFGIVKPTQMVAVLRPSEPVRVPRCWRHWTPDFCVRNPDIEIGI